MNKVHCSALIPFCRQGADILACLQKRSASALRLPGHFGFFGGEKNTNESSEQTLVREIKEELGIDISVQQYQLFAHYEFYARVVDIFTLEVSPDFLNTVTVFEGDYGKFFSESEVEFESRIILPDKVILKNFFGVLKRQNPFS